MQRSWWIIINFVLTLKLGDLLCLISLLYNEECLHFTITVIYIMYKYFMLNIISEPWNRKVYLQCQDMVFELNYKIIYVQSKDGKNKIPII